MIVLQTLGHCYEGDIILLKPGPGAWLVGFELVGWMRSFFFQVMINSELLSVDAWVIKVT